MTARDGICLVLGRWRVSFTRSVLKSVWSYVEWGVYFTRPVLASLSLFDCWVVSIARPMPESVSSKSGCGVSLYTSRSGICLVVRQERSLSYTPGAVIFLVLKRVGSFSYTPRVSSLVGRGISLTRPVLVSVLD